MVIYNQIKKKVCITCLAEEADFYVYLFECKQDLKY